MSVETMTPLRRGAPDRVWLASGPAAALVWWLAYGQLIPVLEWARALVPTAHDSHAGAATAFLPGDLPKVLPLLVAVVFVFVGGILRSRFGPETTRAILPGRRAIRGHPLAAAPSVLTPFRACASVPLVIGFVAAGIVATGLPFDVLP